MKTKRENEKKMVQMKSYIQQKKQNKVNPLPGKKNLHENAEVTVIGPQAPEQMLKAARGCLV